MRPAVVAAVAAVGVVVTVVVALVVNAKQTETAQSDKDFAHDTAMVCRWLDTNGASPESFILLNRKMTEDGLSDDLGEDTVAYAIAHLCPEYLAELQYAAAVT